MKKLIFLLEEQSAESVLNTILPKILPDNIQYHLLAHKGKTNLRKSIIAKMKAWKEQNVQFIILHDKDSADCKILKRELTELAKFRPDTLIRIVCTELESWFLGDLDAVEKAFGVNLSKMKNKRLYQEPDKIANAKQELKKLIPQYQQISGSKAISVFMDIEHNKSQSFQIFLSGIRRICNN